MNKRYRERPWYPMAVAACIAVVLFVFLTHLPSVWAVIRTLVSYFQPVILGGVIAYAVNPLARLYERRIFRGLSNEKRRWILCNSLAFVTVILILVIALMLLLPQLGSGLQTLAGNLDGYMDSLEGFLEGLGISSASLVDLHQLIESSGDLLQTAADYLTENLEGILAASASAGSLVLNCLIAFILSIYLLAGKVGLKAGFKRFLKALFPGERYESVCNFLRRCDAICTCYIVYNLIDCLIVGTVNAIFMVIMGMQYVGLVSFIVAAMNLIPTFGPLIGAALGGFILLMVNPLHALIFLIFALILQLVDGYLLKPRLFGNSLGVSGLLILIGVIIGGKCFGVVGILLAIPGVAILDLLYRDGLLAWLEARRQRLDAEEQEK